MSKKSKQESATIELEIGTGLNASEVTLEWVEPGVYLGELRIGPDEVGFHVEAVEIGNDGAAKNKDYQNRLDRYEEANEGEKPQAVELGDRKFFVHVEPYAV